MIKHFFTWVWHVVLGTYRNIFNKNTSLSDERIKICNECDKKQLLTKHISICSECGCILESKTKVDNESCPMNKW